MEITGHHDQKSASIFLHQNDTTYSIISTPDGEEWKVSLYHITFNDDKDQAEHTLLAPAWTTPRPFSERHRLRDAQIRDLLDIPNAEDAVRKMQVEMQPYENAVKQHHEEILAQKRQKAEEERNDAIETAAVTLSTSEIVQITDNGVILQQWTNGNGPPELNEEKKIVQGTFIPVRRLELDEETVFEVEAVRTFRGNAKEILSFLEKEGQVVHRYRAADAINALLTGTDMETVKGHSAYGVYIDDGELSICLDPEPRSEQQQQVMRQLEKYVDTEADASDIEAWAEISNHWRTYEYLPLMGLSVIAPFGLILRKNGILVPYIYHLSPESGLGKSKTIELFVTDLFGKDIEGGSDVINSPYRLADALDHYGGVIGIEEGESFKWGKFSAQIQQAVERPIQDRRGAPGLGSRPYFSRATPAVSGNSFPTRKKALLTRFIVVEFDRTTKSERSTPKAKRALKDTERKLRPIGWRIVEHTTQHHGTAESLVAAIEQHERDIEDHFPVSFEDARRARIWGVVYEGLKSWERFAAEVGADWEAPSIEEFIEKVIMPIETTAFDVVEAPVVQFVHWWATWKMRNTTKKTVYDEGTGYSETEYEYKGMGQTWKRHVLNGEEGDWITRPILDLYERENQYKGEWVTMSLNDLRRGVESLTEFSDDSVPDTSRIDGKVTKGAFIPDSLGSGLRNRDCNRGENDDSDDQRRNQCNSEQLRENQTTNSDRNHVTGKKRTDPYGDPEVVEWDFTDRNVD